MTPRLDALMVRLPLLEAKADPTPTPSFAALVACPSTDDAANETRGGTRPPLPDGPALKDDAEPDLPAPPQADEARIAESDTTPPTIPFALVVPEARPVARAATPSADHPAQETEPEPLPIDAARVKPDRSRAPATVPDRPHAKSAPKPIAEPISNAGDVAPRTPIATAPPAPDRIKLEPVTAPTTALEATPVPKRIELVLQPERLGRIRLTLSLAGAQPQLRIVAATEAGFAALNADRDALLPILRDVRGGEGEIRIVLQTEPTANAPAAASDWTFERSGERASDRHQDRSSEPRERDNGRDRETPSHGRQAPGERERHARYERGDGDLL